MWGYYFQQIVASFPFFLKGLGMTVLVSLASLAGGTILGFLIGIARSSSSRIKYLSPLFSIYVDFMRGTPFLVQLFIIFFIFPEFGLQLEALTAAILSLTIYAGAYICEIVAGGLDAVPTGQREAALAFGLTRLQQLRYVILPQAMRTILPPLVGQYVLLIKDTSVVSVIGVTDVTRVGWLTVQRVPEGLMVFGLVGILYFAVCFPLIKIANKLERLMTREEIKL